MSIEFEAFPKIARLNRNITITEKLDGTNAAVVIQPGSVRDSQDGLVAGVLQDDVFYHVAAQSRKRIITPGKGTDNYGFAGWVQDNADGLVALLGPGRHFGEWWGAGIQSGYGLPAGDKRFSLFNTARFGTPEMLEDIENSRIPGLGVVPVLYEGVFDQRMIERVLQCLYDNGSEAARGFDRPEGIVIYHQALRTHLKVTLDGDEAPKGAAGHALDIDPSLLERVAA